MLYEDTQSGVFAVILFRRAVSDFRERAKQQERVSSIISMRHEAMAKYAKLVHHNRFVPVREICVDSVSCEDSSACE